MLAAVYSMQFRAKIQKECKKREYSVIARILA
jgi:hypothetical protein